MTIDDDRRGKVWKALMSATKGRSQGQQKSPSLSVRPSVRVPAKAESRTGSEQAEVGRWSAASRVSLTASRPANVPGSNVEENSKEADNNRIVAQIIFMQQHILASYIISQFIKYVFACVRACGLRRRHECEKVVVRCERREPADR